MYTHALLCNPTWIAGVYLAVHSLATISAAGDESEYDAPPPEARALFDAAYTHVYHILTTDSFPRYC
jgi:hypothetical protein